MTFILSENQINILKSHWAFDSEIIFHRRVANFVFFSSIDGRDVVLRLTENSHRTKGEIESELHWMAYLSQHGISVAAPIKTFSDYFVVEIIQEKIIYHATVFEKARGNFIKFDNVLDPEIVRAWGALLGKMHRVTKNYVPPKWIQPRHQWDKDETLKIAMRSVDKNDGIPYQRLCELMEWMRFLPQDKNCYGLVHCDFHNGNFFVDNNGDFTVFDFDDSCYQWFSYDIVPAIHSIHKNNIEDLYTAEKLKTMEMFLKGYSTENILDSNWIERIQIFDKYRAVLLFYWLKTFLNEGLFDANGVERAKNKLPKFLAALQAPLILK